MIKVLKNNYELMLLMIAAFAIRLINLGKLNLWFDEGITAETLHKGLSFIIRDSFTAEPTPPLYNILMYYWVELFGDSEFALRFPSAFFGALSISLVYLIGKKYVSKEVGILSGVLLIGNQFYLYYSQEARGYALFSFLSLLSVYYFPKALVWEDKKKYLWATILVPWVHAYGVFLILAQNLYVLIKIDSQKKSFLKTWIKYQSIIILSASSWYITFLIKNKKYANRFKWIEPVTFDEVFKLFKSFIGKSEFIAEMVLAISLVMAIFLRKKQKNNHDLLLFIIWPLSTALIPIIVGHFWQPFFIDRYMIAASMVIVICVLSPMDLYLKSKKIFITLIILMAAFNFYQLYGYFYTADKDRWTDAIQIILKNDQQKSIVILEDYVKNSSLDYYLRKMDLKNKIQPYYLEDFNQAKLLIKDRDYVWFIYFGARYPKGFNKDQYFIEEKYNRPYEYIQLVKIKVRSSKTL